MTALLSDSWWPDRRADVLDGIRDAVARRAASPGQRAFLDTIVAASTPARPASRFHAAVHLPLLVYAGVRGDDAPAVPLAAATSMVWIGAELYDHLTDGDLPAEFRDRRPFEIVFAATALGTVLPAAVLGDLDVSPGRRRRLQEILARRLLHAFDGQAADLATKGRDEIDTTAVEASVSGKNGAPKALYTELAATAAGAPVRTVRAYAAYGHALGMVYQFTSDHHELFFDPEARDLVQGVRTLHIAVALEGMDDRERTAFLELLERARREEDAREAVRETLRRRRHVAAWWRVVKRHVDRAEAALDEAAPQEPAAGALRRLLHDRKPSCG